PSETWARSYLWDQNVNRTTIGAEVRHHSVGWLTHRRRRGFYNPNISNISLLPHMLPYDATFFSATTAAGSKTVAQTNTLKTTIDYSATATGPVPSGLR